MTFRDFPDILNEENPELAKWIREVTRIQQENVIDFNQISGLVLGGREVFALAPSANQNNYSTGITPRFAVQSTLRISPSNTLKITGIDATGLEDGKIVRILNAGLPEAAASRLLILERESPSSTAANRFNWGAGVPPILLMPGDWAQFEYDETSTRWRYMSGNRGFMNLAACFDVWGEGHTVQPFSQSVSGAGAAVNIGTHLGGDTTERPFACVSAETGTTATGFAYWQTASSLTMFTNGCLLHMARAVPVTLSDGTERYQVFCGFNDADLGTQPTDGAYWEYDDSVSGDWRTVTANNGTRTKTTQGPTVSTSAFHTLGVFVNYDGTRADFFYMTGADAVTIAATGHTTNLPPNTRYFGIGIGVNKTVGTTNRTLQVDWQGYRSQVKRGA